MFQDELWLLFLFRALVASLIVIFATVLAERVSAFYASLIGAFPTSAGPAYIMLAIKEDASFVALSALYSMASMAAIAPFVTVLIICAPKRGIFTTIVLSLVTWLIFISIIREIQWTPFTALILNLFIYSICFYITAKVSYEEKAITKEKGSWGELIFRCLAVGLFVAFIVTASNSLGPNMTGLSAVFPIVLLVLTIILYTRFDGSVVAITMYSALRVVSGLVFVMMALHYGINLFGELIGLIIAFLSSIMLVLLSIFINKRFDWFKMN